MSDALELMSCGFEAGQKVWICLVCQYATRIKTNLREHVEAKHLDSPSVQCVHCQAVCPNKKSLRNHVYKYHKAIKEDFY